MDCDYARNLGEDGNPLGMFEHSLFVLTTIMSVPCPERLVVDAGTKVPPMRQGPTCVASVCPKAAAAAAPGGLS
jgi:3-hydroxy-D-aspartate aldolase